MSVYSSTSTYVVFSDFPRDVQLTTEEPLASDGVQEIEAHALRQLMKLGSCLVEEGVGFVGCQKVVHPLLKDYWRERVSPCNNTGNCNRSCG